MKAVAYIRLTDDGSSLAQLEQRAAIETWAERQGVEITAWSVDVGIDGAVPIAERPGLVAAYRAIREHRAGILVAANADRFTRDDLVAWLIERAALTEGATIHTADGSRVLIRADNTPEREAQGYTRGAVDLARAYDRVTSRARARTALAERRARGERVGTIPYGHKLAEDGVHLVPNEAEQAVIALVRSLSAKGLSQRAIVRQLETKKLRGRTGAPLRQTQIANILRAV